MPSAEIPWAGASAHRGAPPVRARVLWAVGVLIASGCAPMPPDADTDAVPAGPAIPLPEVSAMASPEARTRTLEIDLGRQGFRYLEDGRLVRAGPLSAGSLEHPTPFGRFRVLSKHEDKVSHSYTNAFDMPTPMPYSMQFHGPYFIHEGWVPGYPDSHGCVRLRYEDARFLFGRMRLGDAVVIADSSSRGSWLRAAGAEPAPRQPSRGEWLAADDPRRSW